MNCILTLSFLSHPSSHLCICKCIYKESKTWLKGTVSRDFLLLVFFMNPFPPSSRVFHVDSFKFFRKFSEIFASQGAPLVSTTPPVSTTPAAKLPPVSMTPVANCHRYQRHRWQIFPPFLLALLIPVANLPPVSTTPVENCHRYQRHRRQICHRCLWHRWQIMATISGCRQLKVNLKAKIYIYVNSTSQRCPKKIIKICCFNVFAICHRCRWHRWQILSCEYLREFLKKFETALML